MPTTPRPVRVPDDVWKAAHEVMRSDERRQRVTVDLRDVDTVSGAVVAFLRALTGVRTPAPDGRADANRARAHRTEPT